MTWILSSEHNKTWFSVDTTLIKCMSTEQQDKPVCVCLGVVSIAQPEKSEEETDVGTGGDGQTDHTVGR